ncbi:MAG: hypothetical protein N2448_04365 [Caloramator sp.]|nr:hypothetical protein [Caloramator sp.]
MKPNVFLKKQIELLNEIQNLKQKKATKNSCIVQALHNIKNDKSNC